MLNGSSQNANGSYVAEVYHADGWRADGSYPISVTAQAVQQTEAQAGQQGPPIQVQGQRAPQMAICRGCRREYALRLGENDSDARYFRCIPCGNKQHSQLFEWEAFKSTCSIQ